MIYLVLLVPVLAVLLWLGNGIRQIGAVSRGRPVGARGNTALLMIDLQSVFWDDGPYRAHDRSTAEAAIAAEAARARQEGIAIIAVRQEWSIPATRCLARLTMGGRAIAGTPGTELAAPFADLPDHVLVKRVQDAFETGALDALLAKLDVGTLRIVGLDARYCVATTTKAARRRGYAVEVVTGGVLSADPVGPLATLQKIADAGVVLR
ncbi:isochorismatase family cysteine hydrolase [uncultured Tateyamaria sp.]|uniref:cysteine hydrolase family protein n=1 Tax=Tateyamaria sp. 1078 TaxID=3417464 RepID=UPI00262E86CE|nr:isochorismatase family cysteine hydrolase [uncultured Tateyamaria sp.]